LYFRRYAPENIIPVNLWAGMAISPRRFVDTGRRCYGVLISFFSHQMNLNFQASSTFHVQKKLPGWIMSGSIQLLDHQQRHQIGIPLQLKLLQQHHYDAVQRELPCQFKGLDVVDEIQ
jgi:hypothetical protein